MRGREEGGGRQVERKGGRGREGGEKEVREEERREVKGERGEREEGRGRGRPAEPVQFLGLLL